MYYERLTDAHKIFVDSYVDCLNQRRAYQTMYPESGYNYAKTAGSDLMAKDYIRNAVIEKLKERTIDKTEVLERMIKILQFDITEYLDDKLNLKLESLKADGYGWLIKGYKKGKIFEIMLMDKDRALENLAKIHQMFTDNQTVNVNINQEISAKEQLNQKLAELSNKLNSYDGGK